MKVKKKKKEYKIEFFLTEISKAVSMNEDGNLAYKGLHAREMLRLLQHFIEFPKCAEHLNKSKLISNAFKDLYAENNFTETSFLSFINDQIQAELQKQEETYYVLTTLSIDFSSLKTTEYQIFDCNITLKQKFSEMFADREKVLKNLSKEMGLCDDLDQYSRVEIKVKSRNENEALSRALDAVHLIRALMNLELNNIGIIMGDFYKPINKIRLGKVHTLHNDKGEAFDHPTFYEPEFQRANSESPKKLDIFDKNTSTMLERVSESTFSRKLENALIRYVDAMDIRDKNVSVIKLWAALESLVGEGNCDKLETRICALYGEQELATHVVMHIREYRNEHVHQGIDDEESIHRAYYLQNLFKQVLYFYTHPKNNFASLKEANSLLDKIAMGRNKITDEIASLQKALAFFAESETD